MKKSAGILLYRLNYDEIQFFLVHPGGPFWAKKDLGSWSIPKGEFNDDEDTLSAALREFEEETGIAFSIERNKMIPLNPVKLKSGKMVYAWAAEGDIDIEKIQSNTFELDWPPKSGKKIMVPEIDKGGWFSSNEAKEKINPGQIALIEEAVKKLL